MANPLKPKSIRPYEDNWAQSTNEWADWVTSAINQAIGQGTVPPGKGISSLSPGIVNPSTPQLSSSGSRTQSIATSLIAVSTTTTITFYWDGTNGSTLLSIYRDDGTIAGPFSGSLIVSGLTPSTTYFFYPYYQETQLITTAFGQSISSATGTSAGVHFVSVPTISVGTPAIAFTAGNLQAAAIQYLRDKIPLSLNFATTGVATTAAGTTSTRGGTGGGGGSAGGGRYNGL